MKEPKWYKIVERRFKKSSLTSYQYRKAGEYIIKYGVDYKRMIANGYQWTVVLCFIDGDAMVIQCKNEDAAKDVIKDLDNIFGPILIGQNANKPKTQAERY